MQVKLLLITKFILDKTKTNNIKFICNALDMILTMLIKH